MDRPGQCLLMPCGGHGIAPRWQFRQEERPLAVCVKHTRALCVGHDDVHIGRILRARGVFDGKFERQWILRGGRLERLRFILPDATTDIGHRALGLLRREGPWYGGERQRGHEKATEHQPGCDKRCALHRESPSYDYMLWSDQSAPSRSLQYCARGLQYYASDTLLEAQAYCHKQ